ncbi:MAG TPA: bifunctional [glutamate--ammonia ligase]-adenylyl-L-tyrosine phosphorylase/[glutamate--ammonia-ligase] adenylyltransferase, partial [Verrucomicrobiae bacterium]|nr:bifunctional [glutamate--ammonia ligase]-adenylyl-L-tyrosine phosphorylase/[glutamate--ammonia-ligase] adenylyltransferase [Verrucomicrobiae bacterium]
GSQALSNWLIANPDALALLKPELLHHPRRSQGLQREVGQWLEPLLQARDYSAAFTKLREFKQREMLRIAARDLAHLGNVSEITRELSDVADVCLDSVWRICDMQFTERLGRPFHKDAQGRWQPTAFCVFGMGKLGGQELNYSSDVDVIFVYSEEGQIFKEPPTKQKTSAHSSFNNHQFFNRLAEQFIAEVGRMSGDGMLYRIDLRLRPEGDAGPLARSLSSYENYYAQWGQTWERMMLLKARCVAGDKGLGAEFLEMVHPFRYPRSIGEGVLREVAAMKDRIENEVVKTGELERNVKLGRGGIREIEFIAQTLQLLHAGRQPFLQGGQTLPVLEKLRQYELLPAEDTVALADAYRFLRDVEHRLQMEDNRQTHTIPADHGAQERLAALMGFQQLDDFETAFKRHTQSVRGIYDRLLKSEAPEVSASFPRQFEGAEDEWSQILAEHGFKNVDQSIRMLNEFAHGPGYVHVSNRTVELAWQLIPKFLALCPGERKPANAKSSKMSHGPVPAGTVLSDPDRVLTRLDSFVASYGARATLFEIWNSNPAIFTLLLLLFDRSEFLAEAAIHAPDLVDELVSSDRLRKSKTAQQILDDLRHGREDADQRLWLRRYHQAEFMRIGLRDILGLADFEQNLAELSALADACLQYALEAVLRKHKIKTAPFVIIGLGKLGGAEINYGSDLDIMFVTDARAGDLPKLQRLAIEVMDMLSSRTELGVAFLTDARLRPDGEKGLLVNTLNAYETYYRHRAQLWEIQSISRTRPVAGDMRLGEQFQELVSALTNFTTENVAANFLSDDSGKKRGFSPKAKHGTRNAERGTHSGLAAYSPQWKSQIHRMRQRIEKERTPPGEDALAIKTGSGGLMDAEFLAQTFCLAHGWQEPNTLKALLRARDEGALARKDADILIENYRQLRRVEGILRRWSFEGETVLPDDPAPYYRVSVRCGFETPEAFRQALAKYRKSIRSVYSKVFEASR